MDAGVEHLINYGVLGIIVAFVLWAIWHVGRYGGARALNALERYVISTENMHDSLKETMHKRDELCAKHAVMQEALQISSLKQADIAEESCEHLRQLVLMHNGSWRESLDTIHKNNAELARVKKAALRACSICRTLAQNEFPNSATAIISHCDEIERIISEV